MSGPGGLAAKTCGVPVIIHEQNAVAGTANRLLVPMTSRVCEAFPGTFAASQTLRSTGNPVRPELFTLAPRAPLEGRKARLLVLGGRLGAEPLNKLLPEALAKVPAQVRPEVFHQAGKQHAVDQRADRVNGQFEPRRFFLRQRLGDFMVVDGVKGAQAALRRHQLQGQQMRIHGVSL